MEPLGWFILACVVVGFIIFAYINGKVSSARKRRLRRERLPDAPAPLVAGKTYNLQISNGRKIESVTVIGMSEEMEEFEWDMRNWVVVRAPDGRMIYLRPRTIRYIEEA